MTHKVFQQLVLSEVSNTAFFFPSRNQLLTLHISFLKQERMNCVFKFPYLWQICNSWVLPLALYSLWELLFSMISSWSSENYSRQNSTAKRVCLSYLSPEKVFLPQISETWTKPHALGKEWSVVLPCERLQRSGQRREGSILASTPELCLTAKLVSNLSMACHQHLEYT